MIEINDSKQFGTIQAVLQTFNEKSGFLEGIL